MTQVDTVPTEPHDGHSYGQIWFKGETIQLITSSLRYYREVLEADLQALRNDTELAAMLGEIDALPLARELARIAEMEAWLADKRAKHGGPLGDLDLSLTHRYVRFTKSVCLLYLAHLRQKRNDLANRAAASTHLVSSVDSALGSLEESMFRGVFETATPSPLLVDDVLLESTTPTEAAAPQPQWPSTQKRPATLLLPSIELLDAELRSRCVDLFSIFSDDGEHRRLDTVVTEATRVLEDRLRRVSQAPATTVGVDLASYALAGREPRVRVSSVPAEQESAYLLFRGVFGYIRNHVHHHLTGPLVPQRVLQILGMVDYLLSLTTSEAASSPTAMGESGN